MQLRQYGLVSIGILLVAGACAADDPKPMDPSPRIFSEVPAEIDPGARYLFYLHGRIIEEQGVRPTHPTFGVYEYQQILEIFAERGFVVISEARPEGTDARAYAARVADQVRALLAAGAPPEHITVVGFSKGGGVAITASSLLRENAVNFVFMGACGPWLDSRPEIVPRGRLLALREASDELVGTCQAIFARAVDSGEQKETVLELGGGHGAFYRPRPEWVDPVVEWALAVE